MTGVELARNGNGARAIALSEWDDTFRELVKSTVLKPKGRVATDAELALFAEQAVRTGLDPMARQIYGIFRKNGRTGQEEMTIQVGVDGLRSIAERTGHYAGGPAYMFCGQEKVWTDVWTDTTKPVAARATVLKAIGGAVIETTAIALWSEYGASQNVWRDKPAHMLGKCAEALALRKAFPLNLSGLYTDDEMARADLPASAPVPAAVPAQAEVVEGVELVSSEQADTILKGIELLPENVKFGKVLVAHGATVARDDIPATVRSLPAASADTVAKWISDQLDKQVPA